MHYVFGDNEVDTQRDELRHGGIPCPLESQVFQVFVYLVQHRDRVVSKAELLEYLWPQQYIRRYLETFIGKGVALLDS